MTYTREQLEQMDGFELSRLASESMGWVEKYDEWYRPTAYGLERMTECSWIPAMRQDHSRIVQSEAIKHNPSTYVDRLSEQACAEIVDHLYKSHIIEMLQATPRQITVAAILTLQGESGGTGE